MLLWPRKPGLFFLLRFLFQSAIETKQPNLIVFLSLLLRQRSPRDRAPLCFSEVSDSGSYVFSVSSALQNRWEVFFFETDNNNDAFSGPFLLQRWSMQRTFVLIWKKFRSVFSGKLIKNLIKVVIVPEQPSFSSSPVMAPQCSDAPSSATHNSGDFGD